MPTRDEIYTAIRNADKVGDSESVRKLGAYLQTMQDTPAPAPDESIGDKIAKGAGNALAGAVRGAGSIGATLLYPIDKAQDLYYGDRNQTLTGLVTGNGKKPLSRNDERRASMDDALRSMGADTDSLAYKGGKIGAEVAGTLGTGGAIANGIRALAPGAAAAAPNILAAIESAGMSANGAGMATRMAGGAVTGAASAGLVDPSQAKTGGVVGALLPPALQGVGQASNVLAKLVRGPEVPEDLRAAAQAAGANGYVIPPTQVKPSLPNRLLEGFSGKISTAQNASAKNQAVTNSLVAKELGLSAETKITPEVLDGVRADAGEAYQAITGLGKLEAAGADLPKSVAVKKYTDTLTMAPRTEVDAGEVVRAWKQANHDATGYYRAYGRDANPETLAKAKAAKAAAGKIDDFLTSTLEGKGMGDMVEALKAARVKIAKTYSAESAMNATTGTIDARKLAKALQSGKVLSGGLRDAGEFAARFPKAAQPVEGMGSLPQTSPLDWALGGSIASATANPLAMLSVLARPAARAATLSPAVQRGLSRQAAASPLEQLLANPDLQQAVYRAGPALVPSR
jgi:hypothetical protein